MRKTLLSIAATLCFTISFFAQNMNWQWAKQIEPAGSMYWGGLVDGNVDNPYLDVDINGNIYLTGDFDSTLTFGTIILTDSSYNQYGWGKDIFAAKFNNNGAIIWAKSFPGFLNDRPKDIVVDGFGNMYIIAEFISQTIKVGNFNLTHSGLSPTSCNNDYDILITKLDSNGNVIWAKSFGKCGEHESVIKAKVDAIGNFYFLGSYGSSINLANTTLNGGGNFIAKFDPLGNLLLAKQLKFSVNDFAIDNAFNIYTTGSYIGGPHIFGNSTLPQTLQNWTLCQSGMFEEDMFFAKYDQFGNEIWAKSSGASHYMNQNCTLNPDVGKCINIDNQNNIFVSGTFTSDNFYGLICCGNPISWSGNMNDIFVAKHDISGNLIWVKSIKNQPTSYAKGVDGMILDNAGNCYITGGLVGSSWTSNVVLFDAISIGQINMYDTFVAKYAANGNVSWVLTSEMGCKDSPTGINIDSQNNLYIAGIYGHQGNNTGCPIVFGTDTLPPAGKSAYMAKIGPVNTLGANEYLLNKNIDLKVFPNPSNDHITIDNGNLANLNGYQIKIMNSLSQQVFQSAITQQQFYIDLSSWTGNGIYFVHIIDGQGNTVDVKKIILQ